MGLTGFLVAALIAGFLMFLSWVFKKSSSRQPSQGPPNASGKVAQRLASADPAGQLPPISPNHGTQPKQRVPKVGCSAAL